MTDHSPKILRVLWGEMHVEGLGRSKDVKVYPGGARAWDWAETGTAHYPGIQPADVQELLDHGARVIVFGVGLLERLRVRPETLRLLDERGVTTHVAATPEAVARYNELAGAEAVGGLFHSTC
ncbi:hypothetical protein Ani05nite_72340 [Amorphoplanes nipponensis]|uniref:Mth938-like domain-containing protein n=2 Tax=Actinoplanes nipponensis TaxID=135950 RepID=A0A919JQX0_9ACTN|nr:Mth938-like domain-containing protein [Actinoplanes nipponensis]GIE53700.1 hypothetical protein Ani05nite_72340 [Actinoplanes nipponensis]